MDELAKKFADLAERYGPSVVDAARNAAAVEAYSCLAGGVMAAAIAALMFLGGRFLYRKSCETDWDEDWCIPAFALMGLSIIPAAMALWAWLDPWTWTAMSHPDLWIAKRVLKL